MLLWWVVRFFFRAFPCFLRFRFFFLRPPPPFPARLPARPPPPPCGGPPAAARPAAQTELPEGYWYGVTLSADALPGELPPGPRFALHENAGPPGSPAWRLPADPAVPPGPTRALTG